MPIIPAELLEVLSHSPTCLSLNNKFYSHPSQEPHKKDADAFNNYHVHP